MKEFVPKYVTEIAKVLRKKQVKPEAILWEKIRNNKILGYKFRRQHPIGRYIADFYCDKLKLVIELDGGIHKKGEVKKYDKIRQQEIESREVYVLRFNNEDIYNDLENVILVLKKQIGKISIEGIQFVSPNILRFYIVSSLRLLIFGRRGRDEGMGER